MSDERSWTQEREAYWERSGKRWTDVPATLASVQVPIKVAPSEDIPDLWLAVCRPLNIVAQGESEEDARAAIVESIELYLKHCGLRDLDPQRVVGEEAR